MAVGRPRGWRPDALRARRETTGMVLEQAAEAVRQISSADFEAPRATFQVIGRHERGETYPGPRYRRAYCLIYGATETELGFAAATPSATPRSAEPGTVGTGTSEARSAATARPPDVTYFTSRGPWQAGDTVDLLHRLTNEDFSLNRRDAARGISGLVFGAALLEPVELWLLTSRATEPARHRPASPVGRHELGEIERAAQLFRSWDDRFGGGLRRKAVVGQLNEVTDLLRDYRHPPDLTRRLFAVMSQLAETAATMSWDSGQGTLAQRYYLLALRAAKEAGDRPFGANVLAGMARQLLYAGRTTDALELVRLAHEGLRGQPATTTKAMLFTREAWCYAKQGRTSAFRRATGRAEEAIANRNSAEADPYWIQYFDAAEFAGVTGGRMLDLARARPATVTDAVAYIERAVELRDPARLRSSALDKIGLAEARLVQREYEEAAKLGHAAVDAAERTDSDRVRVKLGRLYRSAETASSAPCILSLRGRLRPLVSAATPADGQ